MLIALTYLSSLLVKDGYIHCSKANDKKCSEQHWDVADDLLHLADHLDYMEVKTSLFGCKDQNQSAATEIVV